MKTKTTRFLLLLVILAGTTLFTNINAQSLCQGQNSHRINLKMLTFRENMRMLWEDHIVYTRNVIFNILDDLPGTNEAVGRLLQNQDDIGDAIKPYYGNAAGDQLTALLYGHISIAANLLTALKNNDTPGFNLANQQWTENADSIALFLSGANPYWDYTELQNMLYEHLSLTATEAAARKNLDYAADIVAYDNVHAAILEMADMLSCGIMQQFPSEFRGNNREGNIDVTLSGSEIALDQNMPNPFTELTVISFFIPEYVNDAQVQIFNSNGLLIKTVVVEQRGEGSLTIHARNLQHGTYSYSLLADGNIIETRKMVH